jgi:hypothetical protein
MRAGYKTFTFLGVIVLSAAYLFLKENIHIGETVFSDIQRAITGNSCGCVAPNLINQPQNPSPVCSGNGTISFAVHASGTPPLAFRWRDNNGFLSDDSVYSGTHTAILIIQNPPDFLNGNSYSCQITNCSGQQVWSVTTFPLSLYSLPTDINQDSKVNYDDFQIINNHINTTCSNCREDINHDQIVDNKDFLLLLGDFGHSCN